MLPLDFSARSAPAFGNSFFDEEWHNLNTMFSTCADQESDVCLGLNFKIPDIFLSVSDEHCVNVCESINPNGFYHFLSQENNCIGSSDVLNPNQESFPFCPSPHLSNHVLFSQENLYLTQDVGFEKVRIENSLVSSREIGLKRQLESFKSPDAVIDDVTCKKRVRVSRDNNNEKNMQSKKNQKMNDTEERNKKNNVEIKGQCLSSCSSNDELNLSQDFNIGPCNSNGKMRASRGSATDPQSLYARKRRERINERLRILQKLIPNGTKVDISTMLEEAVEYVKFLKLQIQLLSSDDTWMYAPIAYNGVDMGLYQNITSNLQM